jgi:peptidoglycan/LPS O-acetylase OafA/YrhL
MQKLRERETVETATANAPLQAPSTVLTQHRVQLNAMTGARFFAAAYVILFHTKFAIEARARHDGPLNKLVDGGYLAVTFFFLLSGFILAYTYTGQIATGDDRRRFWEARFARLWPLYAFSLLLATIAGFTVPRLPVALAVLAMVQSWNPFNPAMGDAWNTVCWTLSVEAFFYLLFPFFAPWVSRHSAKWKMWALAFVLIVCVVFNISRFTEDFDTMTGLAAHIPFAVARVPEFVAGVLTGGIFVDRLRSGRLSGTEGAAWYTWLGFAASAALLLFRSDRWTSLIVAAFAMLLFGLASERSALGRFLSHPWLVLGGQVSYGMYLLHLPVKSLVSHTFDAYHIGAPALRFAVLLVAVVVLSWGTFTWLETPSRHAIRKAFLAFELRRARALPESA